MKRHGCPSHGIALSPDESEVWLCDSFNTRVHVFDATSMPPKLVHSVEVRDQPGWVSFSVDGKLAIASTGEIIDAKSKRIASVLADESGHAVQSEKLLEVDFSAGNPVRNSDQFGLGGKR